MTIETKFDIGDTIWFMQHNKPRKSEVTSISTRTKAVGKATTVLYTPVNNTDVAEYQVYATQKELIESLYKEDKGC